MKARLKNNEPFTPVTIEITFETQDELDLLGALFNTSDFDQACANIIGQENFLFDDSIWEILEQAGANINKYSEGFDGIFRHNE